jgi:hypothetical protein
MRITDYESMGVGPSVATLIPLPERPSGRLAGMQIFEAYAGTAVVSWYGNIERQIIGMENEYRNANNTDYADKLHQFLMTWRDNPLTGSINIETLQVLEAAAAQNAVDPWKLANYFSNLRDSLRKLIAAQEELPMVEPDQQGGGANRRKAKPQPPSDFGPTAEPPPEDGVVAPIPPAGGAAPIPPVA